MPTQHSGSGRGVVAGVLCREAIGHRAHGVQEWFELVGHDVGCGCGATTLAAAEAVGATGSAHGIDLSEPMLEVARRRRNAAGLANVTFTQADAQTERFEAVHDGVISRFGTMFFDDPTAAFANIATSLRPGARLCVVTWQPLVANDWLAISGAALLRYGTFPDTSSGLGMFAQSDPAEIRTTLERAGYRDIEVEKLDVELRLGDDPATPPNTSRGWAPAERSSPPLPRPTERRRSTT